VSATALVSTRLAGGARLVDGGGDRGARLAPEIEVVLELQAEIALVVPGEAEELGRDQPVFTEPQALHLRVGLRVQAALRARDLDRGERAAEALVRLVERGRTGERLFDQAVELRVGVALPPLRIGPFGGARADRDGDTGERRLVAQDGASGFRGDRAGGQRERAGGDDHRSERGTAGGCGHRIHVD
jgi:hypothetical protein